MCDCAVCVQVAFDDTIYEDDGYVQEDNSPSLPTSRVQSAARPGPTKSTRPHSAAPPGYVRSKDGIPNAPTMAWALKKGGLRPEDLAHSIAAGAMAGTYRSDTVKHGGISPTVLGRYSCASAKRDALRSSILSTIKGQVSRADATATAKKAAMAATAGSQVFFSTRARSTQRPHSASARLGQERAARLQSSRPQSASAKREQQALMNDIVAVRYLM